MGDKLIKNTTETLAKSTFNFLKGLWKVGGSIIVNNNATTPLIINGQAKILNNDDNKLTYNEKSKVIKNSGQQFYLTTKKDFIYSKKSDTLSQESNVKYEFDFVIDQGFAEARAQTNSHNQSKKITYYFEDPNNFSMLEEMDNSSIFFSTLLHYTRILDGNFIDLSGQNSDNYSIE
jgi:hypothetical protein